MGVDRRAVPGILVCVGPLLVLRLPRAQPGRASDAITEAPQDAGREKCGGHEQAGSRRRFQESGGDAKRGQLVVNRRPCLEARPSTQSACLVCRCGINHI